MRSFLVIRSSLLLAALAAAPALAADEADPAATPVGKWKTIDDATGKEKSIVAITEQGGKLYGHVEQLLDPEAKTTCEKCEGELKDQPIVGMRILWGMEKDKAGAGWSGGKILDPKNGKKYKCSLSLADGGKKLDVRGFIGISLIGRTQTWLREE